MTQARIIEKIIFKFLSIWFLSAFQGLLGMRTRRKWPLNQGPALVLEPSSLPKDLPKSFSTLLDLPLQRIGWPSYPPLPAYTSLPSFSSIYKTQLKCVYPTRHLQWFPQIGEHSSKSPIIPLYLPGCPQSLWSHLNLVNVSFSFSSCSSSVIPNLSGCVFS